MLHELVPEHREVAHEPSGQLTGLEFVQYGLDRFASVAELADFAEGAEIVQLAVALHFFVCERGGACVVVELHQGKARIQRKLAVSALANRPYEEDLRAHQPPSGIAAWLGLGRPKPGSSAARFRTVANAARSTTPEDESAALAILERVVMGHRTQWQIVWNLERGTVLLRQREAGLGTLNLRLGDLDGRCAGAPRVRSLGRAVRGAFLPWTEQDAAHTEAAVLLQVGRDSPAPRRLASAVAGATRSSRCLSAQ
ncbi:MAG: hypothetical protein HY901_31395 [Deltaproteobacteria bacterium]|nr:hypothetical protein [Deltaproteobacteria bacterium]